MLNEFSKLSRDVEPEISWACIALQLQPNTVNLWIEISYSVTECDNGHHHEIIFYRVSTSADNVNRAFLTLKVFPSTVKMILQIGQALEVVLDFIQEAVLCVT